MTHKFGKTIVIALGGSIIYPDTIDIAFIKKFRLFINRFVKKGYKFVIVVGGGRPARLFQEAAHEVVPVTDEDKDWLGIHATRLNAHLLRTIFREVADPVIIDSRDKMEKLSARGGSAFGGKYPVTIASGWEPGWSTDYISIALAEDFGAHEAIIAGKPAHVYPIRNLICSQARPVRAKRRATSNGVYDSNLDMEHPYEELTWKKYRKLIPAKWKPGLHSPVDPIGAKLAERRGITAIIINGKDLKNFENMILGKEFKGSIIK